MEARRDRVIAERELRAALGCRIAQRRERFGWSRAEAARRLGVPRSRYAKWESGAHAPPPASLLALSEALETTVDELLTGCDPLAWVRSLSPAERSLVAEALEAVAGWLRGDRRTAAGGVG